MVEDPEVEKQIQLKLEEDNRLRVYRKKIANLVDQTGVEKIRTALELPYDGHMNMLDVIMDYIKKLAILTQK